MNYVNPLLYPVSERNFPGPEHGVIGILIDYLTSKSALLSFTLISDRKLLKISILFHITSKYVIICFFFNSIFVEDMIFCTDTHFIHESSKTIVLNRISFTEM